MTTRVYGAARYSNLIIYSLGGHTDSIVNAFFEDESLDVSFQKLAIIGQKNSAEIFVHLTQKYTKLFIEIEYVNILRKNTILNVSNMQANMDIKLYYLFGKF